MAGPPGGNLRLTSAWSGSTRPRCSGSMPTTSSWRSTSAVGHRRPVSLSPGRWARRWCASPGTSHRESSPACGRCWRTSRRGPCSMGRLPTWPRRSAPSSPTTARWGRSGAAPRSPSPQPGATAGGGRGPGRVGRCGHRGPSPSGVWGSIARPRGGASVRDGSAGQQSSVALLRGEADRMRGRSGGLDAAVGSRTGLRDAGGGGLGGGGAAVGTGAAL